jgi:hypothetical protein
LFVDQLEAISHNLPAILAEFCRIEREIISLQAQQFAMLQTIKQLREKQDNYKEKYESMQSLLTLAKYLLILFKKAEERRLFLKTLINEEDV